MEDNDSERKEKSRKSIRHSTARWLPLQREQRSWPRVLPWATVSTTNPGSELTGRKQEQMTRRLANCKGKSNRLLEAEWKSPTAQQAAAAAAAQANNPAASASGKRSAWRTSGERTQARMKTSKSS